MASSLKRSAVFLKFVGTPTLYCTRWRQCQHNRGKEDASGLNVTRARHWVMQISEKAKSLSNDNITLVNSTGIVNRTEEIWQQEVKRRIQQHSLIAMV